MPHKRKTQMVCNLPRGLRSSEFRIWNIRAFQKRKTLPVSWLDEKLSLLYCPGRGANPRPPAHPDFITSKHENMPWVKWAIFIPSEGKCPEHGTLNSCHMVSICVHASILKMGGILCARLSPNHFTYLHIQCT